MRGRTDREEDNQTIVDFENLLGELVQLDLLSVADENQDLTQVEQETEYQSCDT
jgi:hypothetical protein